MDGRRHILARLKVSSFLLPNVSQWTNGAGYHVAFRAASSTLLADSFSANDTFSNTITDVMPRARKRRDVRLWKASEARSAAWPNRIGLRSALSSFGAMHRRVFVQRAIGSGLIVVTSVGVQDAAQMLLTNDNDVVGIRGE